MSFRKYCTWLFSVSTKPIPVIVYGQTAVMRALLTGIILFLFIVRIHSQDTDADLIFSRNHFSISIIGGIAEKSSFKTFQPTNYNTGSHEQVAFGAGINYHTNFSKELSLIFGLHFAAPVKNFEYYIHKEDFTPPYTDDVFLNKNISREVVFILQVPLSFQKRWWDKPFRFWSATVGASLVYAVLQEEDETHSINYSMTGPAVPYFYMSLQTNNDHKPWTNYHLGVGRGIVLKNYNLVTASLLANLSFTNFEKGDFKFYVPGQSTYPGHFAFKGLYVGIECHYVLTGAKKTNKESAIRCTQIFPRTSRSL